MLNIFDPDEELPEVQSLISKEYSGQLMLKFFFDLDEELVEDQQEQIWNQKLDDITRNCILTCTHTRKSPIEMFIFPE